MRNRSHILNQSDNKPRGLKRAEWKERGGIDAQQGVRGRAALQSIAASTSGAGARLVVIVMAPMDRERYVDRSPNGDVALCRNFIARALGPEVPVLDARDLLGPIRLEDVRLDECCHLNAEGHRRMGAALVTALRGLGFPEPVAAATQGTGR